MHWLIVEDSLESRRGHWFEYLEGFCLELPKLGDQVTLLVTHRAEAFIRERLDAKPTLPESAFSKMSDGASAWKRYARIPIHAWKTFVAIRRDLKGKSAPDVIFVPTVIVHHLLGWTVLVKLKILPQRSRLLLFFPNLPIRKTNSLITIDGSPSSRLMLILLHALGSQISSGRVILGAETHEMKRAGEEAFGVPFTYFPHPVRSGSSASTTPTAAVPPSLIMACYGQARHEKGSDLLVKAIESYLERRPESLTHFTLQWMENFIGDDGQINRLSEFLQKNFHMDIVNRFFEIGEYAKRLAYTHVLLLPYRCSSYGLRISRVAIEGMVNGIPIVVTNGTTLASQASEFGAAVLCEENDKESLIAAIELAEHDYGALAVKARQRQSSARSHFSVEHFRNILLSICE